MRRHILIVDDEELFREICQEMLEERGYRVSVAADASEALAVLHSDHVDLLVADITLPGMDGLTLIEQMRTRQPDLPAIVITGFLTPENMLRSLNLGVRGFLTKPFFYDELFVAVERSFAQVQAVRHQLLLHHYLPMIHLGEEILASDREQMFSKTLKTVLDIGMRQTGAVQGIIAVAGSGNGDFRWEHTMGVPNEERPQVENCLQQVRYALNNHVVELVSEELLRGMNTLAVRMPDEVRRFGTLVLARPKSDGAFSEEEHKLAHFLIIQAAIALHHYESWGHVLAGAEEAEHTLLNLAAAMPPPGTGHPDGEQLQALAVLAAAVARDLGMDDAGQRAVRTAALLHDLGKAFLPPDLLEKQGPLDDGERATVNTYVELGAERLGRSEKLRDAAPLVRHQRERWDGGGYPDRLKGDGIPLGARILGVVSAWGAMGCARPYRPALPREEAVAVLREGRGTAFCPDVVDAFLEEIGE